MNMYSCSSRTITTSLCRHHLNLLEERAKPWAEARASKSTIPLALVDIDVCDVMVKWLPVSTELVEATRQQAPSSKRTQPARHAFWRCVHIFELDLKDWSVIVYCGSRVLKGVRTETEHQAHFTGIAGRSHTNGKRTHALGDLDGSQMNLTI